MTGPLKLLRNTFSSRSSDQSNPEPEPDDQRTETTLHECTSCGSVFIQHSGERCSECGSATLEEQ